LRSPPSNASLIGVNDVSTIADTVSLPPAPAGWFDYAYVALADGRLAIGRTRRNIHLEYLREWESSKGGIFSRRPRKIWPDQLRLSIFDGKEESDAAIAPSGTHPIFDRTSDGHWLVASTRSREGERNARLYSADGTEQAALVLGDAIAHLYCAPDGTIWAGYFDEGVFGGPNQDGGWPVASGGIVQFDRDGAPLWLFNEHVGSDRQVDDCYAMTLAGDDLWACYYSDFPIVRIRGGQVTTWANDVGGAKAMAVDGDLILLAGGYSDDADRITLVRLERDSARPVGTMRFAPQARGVPSLAQGQGKLLHIIREGVWMRLSVEQAARAISQKTGTEYN